MTKIMQWLRHHPCLQLTASQFVFYASLIMTALYNLNVYIFIIEKIDVLTLSGLAIFTCIFLILFLVSYAINTLLVFISPKVFKAFLLITTLVNAAAFYYMITFNVMLTLNMMGNIFNTRYSEAIELFSFSLLVFVMFLGLIPAWLISKIKISMNNRLQAIRNVLVVIALVFSFLYVNAPSWLWIDKYAKFLGGKTLPWSYIINTARYFSMNNKSTKDQEKLPNGQFKDNKKTILVLVIGESARAPNFSLYGYGKKTNPLLKKAHNLLVLNHTQSCATYTTGSLACMLSATKNTHKYEALPTYLTRHGAQVIWRTTNWGEPAISISKYVTKQELRKQCQDDGCDLDEVLLTNLKQTIKSIKKQKALIVLHMKGSHGPSYYTRYTKPFEQFTPVCRHEEISQCTHQELVNAYDNTIVYTDHFLAKIISTLNEVSDIPSAMMYISDHGESLGENGFYLHGAPYSIAPHFQKDIPFLLWISNSLQAQKGIDIHKLRHTAHHSHFNVFHTVLGILNFDSPIYNAKLDILNDKK